MKVFRKMGAVLISLVLIITGMSIGVFAGGGTDLSGIIKGGDSGGNVDVGTQVYVNMSDLDSRYGGPNAFANVYNSNKAKAVFSLEKDGEATEINAQYDGSKFYYVTKEEDVGKTITFFTLTLADDSGYNNNTEALTIVSKSTQDYLIRSSVPNKDGAFTLTGHSGTSEFKQLEIYQNEKFVKLITSGVNNKKDFSFKFDVSEYVPEIYNMTGVLKNGNKVELSIKASDGNFYKTYFQVPIPGSAKPTIAKNTNFFSVGSNYFCFRPYFSVNPDWGKIYIQLYDTVTKQWGAKYGPFGSYEILRTEFFKPGVRIQPNRTYQARILYSKLVTYNGFTTALDGPYSNIVTFRTGKASKPAIKSVKIKAVKIKKTKLIQHAHWDVYGKWIPYKESYIYTTKYKVTVKLKKKPGTVGLVIGDKKIRGNKKTYTATFTDAGRLKGKKLKIGIGTYNDPILGAYGPTVTKKAKVK